MSKQNLEMLEEIFKGAKMGMNATKLYHEHSQHDEKAERAAGSLSGGSDAG